ncbi:hypothetical protein DFP72DRAFT_596697 [Ephemerocybe angulata]|uniref:MARVEL domain-containing protein n=1 Tax=Ephemerocybe angulata TaxID=980116 RepID=A0A8H6MAL5_9AGAR|nr:hypothetical protein DFP72DRAFT_596697 [Tulosesus angulatus]
MSPSTWFQRPFPSASQQTPTPAPISRSRRMPSLFNTARASIYGTVLLFTVICLAMAGHFQSVLAASDLTRFVPFAIFVCSASLFIFTVLVLFSLFLKERNPISTRIELASLGLAGLFWLILGVYLTTSESQDADVECYASPDSQIVLDDEIASFHTDQFQAMYRVLNAFALMNAALIIISGLILLFLAVRRHRNGDKHVWHVPVTSVSWFNTYNNKAGPILTEKPKRRKASETNARSLLPTSALSAGAAANVAAGAAAVASHSRKNSGRTAAAPPPTAYTEKPERKGSRGSGRDARRQDSTGSNRPHRQDSSGSNNPRRQNSSGTRREYRDLQQHNPYMANYYNAPLPAAPRQARYAPSSSSATSTNDFDNGGMVNPARQASQSRR